MSLDFFDNMGVSMGLFAANRPRLLSAIILAGFTFILAWWLDRAPAPWDGLVRSSYDTLHITSPQPRLKDCPVAIVYLDLSSYDALKIDPGTPWPRRLHAQLLNQLTEAGARAVVFDIVFSEAGPDPAGDDAFTEAMRANGRVVLAAEYNNKATHGSGEGEQWVRVSKLDAPFGKFAAEARAIGMAEQIIDDDFGVRRYLAGFPGSETMSLTWATATWLGLPITRAAGTLTKANQEWLRYYGPPLTVPHTTYSAVLSTNDLPKEFFHDKIVFVGGRPFVKQSKERNDEFRNPFHSWANRELFTPGVEVHATEMLNLAGNQLLSRFGQGTEAGWLLLGAVIFGGGLIWLRPVPATIVAIAGAGAVFGLASYGFSRGVWFPWLLISVAEIPAGLAGAVLFHSIEWYRARRRFESKIREQAALIDKAHDAILVEDLQGNIVYANPGAEKLLGWKVMELRGIGRELFSVDPAAAAAARLTANERGEWNGELRLQTREGQIVIVNSRWTLIRNEQGRAKEMLMISTDITERKQLEAQFLRTQRMNTIGNVAGGMAHDLNNALSPILMGVQLLRRRSTDEESTRLLGMMETNTYRSADMVRQVLLFARGRDGEFERLEVRPLVKELEKIVRETFPKNIVVETFLPADLWSIRGNATQMHQVLLNLCVNARDAMPNGGRLSFAADNVELSVAEAAAIPDGKPGSYVSLMVSDTGSGIAPELRAKIFEPFFTTKAEGKGTGIGLSTVLRIVKGHGGCVRLESDPGQGATFEVLLPRAMEATAARERTAPVDFSPGNGELILIADDEQAIRELVSEGLKANGFRVLAASNGEEALKLFQENAMEVRLFLTDQEMPVMNGVQAIAEIRKLKAKLPVIVTSGEGLSGDGTQLLSKPFSLEEVLTAVHQILSPEKQESAGK